MRTPISRVRWDRVGRTAMLIVFALVAVIGVQGALSFIHTRDQAAAQATIVRSLQAQTRQLEAQRDSLMSQQTIVLEARELGMVRPGEQPYAVVSAP